MQCGRESSTQLVEVHGSQNTLDCGQFRMVAFCGVRSASIKLFSVCTDCFQLSGLSRVDEGENSSRARCMRYVYHRITQACLGNCWGSAYGRSAQLCITELSGITPLQRNQGHLNSISWSVTREHAFITAKLGGEVSERMEEAQDSFRCFISEVAVYKCMYVATCRPCCVRHA